MLALGGLLFIFLVATSPIARGRVFPLWDADRQFSTWQMLIADFARNGQLLLWNPWSTGGIPEFAEPQSGALSPLSVACGFLTGGRLSGFVVWWLANWFAGGLGLFFLGRHLRAPLWGAVAVAAGYLFSGFYTGHAEHMSWIHAYAFLPFIVWWFDRACLERSWRRAGETAALWGLSGLAGYPGLLVVTGSVLPLWALGRSLCLRRPRPIADPPAVTAPRAYPTPWRWLMHLALIPVIGALVLSPVYVGYFTEAIGYSTRTQRGGWTREMALSSNALAPGAMATFSSPWLTQVQLQSSNRIWEDNDVSSCSVYVGSVIPFFALIGLISKPRDRWRWWLAAMVGLMLAVAVGDRLPLRGWLYDLLPPYRFFRHSSMFRGYALFFLALLALEGTRDWAGLRDQRVRRRWVCPAIALALAGLALFAFRSALDQSRSTPLPGQQWAEAHVIVAWSIPLVIGLLCLLRPARRAVPLIVIIWVIADAIATVRLASSTIYTDHPQVRDLAAALDTRHTTSLDLLANARPRVKQLGEGIAHNKNLVIKLPTLVNYTALINAYHDRIVDSPALVAMATGQDRTWFSAAPLELPLSDAAIEALVSRADTGGGVPLLLHPRTTMMGEAGGVPPEPAMSAEMIADRVDDAAAVQPIAVTLREYTPARLVFSVHCEREGWLWVTDRWSPGWRATVNGRAAPVYGANGVFRGVKVESGTNDVRFDYDPPRIPYLIVLSWSILLLGLLSSASHGVFRRIGSLTVTELTPAAPKADAPEPEISIVIPCYNVETRIESTLNRLGEHIRRHHWQAEVVVVDDGSEDRTAAVACALGHPHVRVIRHHINAGKGRAVRTGMLAARGRRRVFTDSDLPYRLRDLSAVVDALADSDIAAGNRSVGRARSAEETRPLGRRLSSRVFSSLVSRFYRLETSDTQCGLKGFTAGACNQVFPRCRVNGFSFDVEALIIAKARGLRLTVVPVSLTRSQGSSVRLLRHSIQMMAELAQIGCNVSLGRYR